MTERTSRKLTRSQKTSRTRQKLLDAAMKVVGELGHAEASVANITREADVALGTFYMHFDTKQALLDSLLPWAGQAAHGFMDEAVENVSSHADFEIRNFDALADFQAAHPFYFRLLSESQVATPDAYEQHIKRSIERYAAVLQKARERGELLQFADDEIDVLATMLVSVKLLLFTRYCGTRGPTPAMRRAYFKFVLTGLLGASAAPWLAAIEQSEAKPSPRRRKPVVTKTAAE